MKYLYIAAALGALLGCFWLSAQNDTTQDFQQSRFALLSAELNISNITGSGGISNNVQKSVLKLDTKTGEVWVLQLTVNGTGDPTVRSAVWAKVSNSGPYYPSGPPMGE